MRLDADSVVTCVKKVMKYGSAAVLTAVFLSGASMFLAFEGVAWGENGSAGSLDAVGAIPSDSGGGALETVPGHSDGDSAIASVPSEGIEGTLEDEGASMGREGEAVALARELEELYSRLGSAKDSFISASEGFDMAEAEKALEKDERDLSLNRRRELAKSIDDSLAYSKMLGLELEADHAAGTRAVKEGMLSAKDATSRTELLECLVHRQEREVERKRAELKLVNAQTAVANATFRKRVDEACAAIHGIDEAALEVEMATSSMKQFLKEHGAAVAASASEVSSDGEHADITELFSSAEGLVKASEEMLGKWYGDVGSLAHEDLSSTFGTGVDFLMDEEDFVDKWGKAIDGYFSSISKAQGEVPLQGYGHIMASSAYHHKIDPRLCAAVSMAESSGGKACIRPFNAWGWGAADSDPYGLACEWDSYEEAIEAWHEGMETSTSGLSDAGCVSELACVYCSSPSWGAVVAEQMRSITGFS